MSLIFSASTTRTCLSAVAPFASLPASYVTFPVVTPEPRPAPRTIVVLSPPSGSGARMDEGWEEIELRPMGVAANGHGLWERPSAHRFGGVDEGARLSGRRAPVTRTETTTSGFSARPLHESTSAPRARSAHSRFASTRTLFARGAPPAPMLAEQGTRLCDAVKAAKTTLFSRTRRAFNTVFPALDVRNRGGYVRLRGRHQR
ncbi:uncharacterized protein C8Q71DRAFT_419659 [Rhodofomes roseus]|uniref:Uncharacterized protein n=1 Tax=Rhodofomes roseus TaxID=34475 RepID=A0ABQ8KQN9_9APHY|nr:uncharacterized protein C8Q71DRAFT_419659 [Rhodofomes roseus]KAH9840677.1 hypothetical protein C8Q71DRAFT_419659 [Rhodofomes roseus]